MSQDQCIAVIVAAGMGRRMGGPVSKQFMELKGRPVLAWTLDAFQKSHRITGIVLVVTAGQEDYVQLHIVNYYGFTKVRKICAGGAERYDSVYRGLKAAGTIADRCDYVFIHDGVRPFVTEEIIDRGYLVAQGYGNAVCGMPSKDTVKIVDANGVVKETPPRAQVWTVQTPQIFRYNEIVEAYEKLQGTDMKGITDDAMVMEAAGRGAVRMFTGSYTNIKLTTPEDLILAERFLEKRQ
ncbi:MAG: 2-C-methyl-D-erythritol 4-phosphate cytidylyltransferase [Eubacteriales bacterium]|jgi:2-C-methyl-D-erythritol 4-phosphate cytidylyltransferase